MHNMRWKSFIMLTAAAVIWGFAFVAQRVGNQYIGTFTYTGVRFALGALSIIPLIVQANRKEKKAGGKDELAGKIALLKAGTLAGMVLFIAASMQQTGLKYTTAGKAAFITGFYIILVPVLEVIKKRYIDRKVWIAAALSIIGLYLISVQEGLTVSKGDLLVFICSFFFAFHIVLINNFTQKANAIKLAFVQYLVCSVLSLVTALLMEEIYLENIIKAAVPIIYGGVFSVGIAYTLQVIGQKHSRASHAAIIMSSESVFALIGGMLFLNETINLREIVGCTLMISGVILSQLQGKNIKTADTEDTADINHGRLYITK